MRRYPHAFFSRIEPGRKPCGSRRTCHCHVGLSNRSAVEKMAPKIALLSKNNLLKKRLAAATIVLLVFAVGLWAGWHKDARSAGLSRWHSELTRTIPSASPSPGPLTLTESPVEAMAQTPASWPSLGDQLLREGIELRDRGDTTNAIERLQEALESEPNNAAVLAELAKTYDLMQLYDRANEMWRKLQETGPSAGAAYELAHRRLKLGVAI